MGIINELNELSALRAKIKQLEGRIEYCKEQSMMIPGPMLGEEKIQTRTIDDDSWSYVGRRKNTNST